MLERELAPPTDLDGAIAATLRLREVEGEPRPMLPYYLLLSLPGEEDLSFIIMQPFTPRARPNMVSFLVAKSDADEYGEMIVYNLPAASQQDGPGQVGVQGAPEPFDGHVGQ